MNRIYKTHSDHLITPPLEVIIKMKMAGASWQALLLLSVSLDMRTEVLRFVHKLKVRSKKV